MINIKEKSNCNGCCACVDICPHNSITLQTDIEGFWYPTVDLKTCTDCGLCEKTCPELHADELKKNDFKKPITYAAIHKNLEVRFDSTSGGLFSALAEKTYKDGGYVGGAIYNDNFSVRHFISNNKKDLGILRSSKYLQSDASGLYIEVKNLLKAGEKVLVCGTPCQMAGLRGFLNKDYENLIIVDFVCRGVNSPKVFRKYLDGLEDEYQSKVTHVKAKNKDFGWRELTNKVIFENGAVYHGTKSEDPFMRGYLNLNVLCRPACYDCKFKGFPRIADITLADYWGIEKHSNLFDDNIGTSMVLINSIKGNNFFEEIKGNLSLKEMPFESILAGNPALVKSLNAAIIDRAKFFKDVESLNFKTIIQSNLQFSNPSIFYKIWNVLKFVKHTIWNVLKFVKHTISLTRCYPKPLFQFILLNFLRKKTSIGWADKALIFPTPYCCFEMHKSAKIELRGRLNVGFKKFKSSKLESRILLDRNSKLIVNGDFTLYYGCDIEVFKNGELKIIGGKNGYSNIGLTIICFEKIIIGEGVIMGRNVTIRDNDGGHIIAKEDYKISKPVIIENHVWLGSGCTILKGVTIGTGAIIATNAVVTKDVPPYTLVAGIPAIVIDNSINWKP